jgi:hypothetical protein
MELFAYLFYKTGKDDSHRSALQVLKYDLVMEDLDTLNQFYAFIWRQLVYKPI